MKRFIILFIMIFLMGCHSIPTPLGAYSFSATEKPAPKPPKKEGKSFEEVTGLSPTVATLMGIGAGFMLMSVSATAYDDTNSEVATVITGGTGITFWVSAGIVHLVED